MQAKNMAIKDLLTQCCHQLETSEFPQTGRYNKASSYVASTSLLRVTPWLTGLIEHLWATQDSNPGSLKWVWCPTHYATYHVIQQILIPFSLRNLANSSKNYNM